MEIYKLKRPINFEGELIEELKLDLEELSYSDLERASKEWKAHSSGKKKGQASPVPEVDPVYLACVTAIAAKVPVDLIFALKANDFTQIKMITMNFLLDGESEEEEVEMDPEKVIVKNQKMENPMKDTKKEQSQD